VDPALTLEASALHRSRLLYPGPNSYAGLLGVFADQVAIGDRGNLEVDVDPVEQRPGDA
jgi:hypothetical protein